MAKNRRSFLAAPAHTLAEVICTKNVSRISNSNLDSAGFPSRFLVKLLICRVHCALRSILLFVKKVTRKTDDIGFFQEFNSERYQNSGIESSWLHLFSLFFNSQYFWNWTNANPMKIFERPLPSIIDTYTKPSLVPAKRIWFPANLGLVLT